eukprot:TRINITY_DN19911_c0_g1_i1.p1 TRINITY_DN19911_c0_g1~~TRINITY_DN19911_c0_g1_i1.p1  ORF type:complete len:115 (-),score=16.17 TRINITY_DN19911_c0_g1_i1:53-397(-)
MIPTGPSLNHTLPTPTQQAGALQQVYTQARRYAGSIEFVMILLFFLMALLWTFFKLVRRSLMQSFSHQYRESLLLRDYSNLNLTRSLALSQQSLEMIASSKSNHREDSKQAINI